MRIVVHGQQAFGKAVLEALLKRGDNVVAVYVAPEKEGAKADPLKEAALAAKLPVYQPASYRKPEVWQEFKALKPDLQVMAFVTLLHQAVEQRLVARAPHLLQLDGLELLEGAGDRRRVDEHRCGSCSHDEGVENLVADGR